MDGEEYGGRYGNLSMELCDVWTVKNMVGVMGI